MKNKTILGMWCTNSYCKFIDRKHIQTELTAHIWYSYDNDSKTDVINKKICFVNEIDFNELNNEIEIIEDTPKEEKKILEKLETYKDKNNDIFLDDLCYKYMPIHKDSLSFNEQVIVDKLNEVLDYLKSKGE